MTEKELMEYLKEHPADEAEQELERELQEIHEELLYRKWEKDHRIRLLN